MSVNEAIAKLADISYKQGGVDAVEAIIESLQAMPENVLTQSEIIKLIENALENLRG